MEVGGFVIGVVGLAGLFSTCVDCFKLVQVYRARRQDYDVLQTMLDNQQFHLIAWGMACGFVEPHQPNKSFDDPLSAARNARIERTLDSIQSLLTNTDKLRNRYGLKAHRQAQGLRQIEGPAPSAFARAFQNTRVFWNTSLQRTVKTAGSVLWTVNDKDKFAELIEELAKLIQDLEKFTEDLGISQVKSTIVEYEMQIIGEEGSLEAIAEASAAGEDDDIVSSAARRQLDRVKERTVLTQALLQPDDSVSVMSLGEHDKTTEAFEALDDEDPDVLSPIGIQRVKETEWRKVKPRQGILPWLPILLVSMTSATLLTRRDTADFDAEAELAKPAAQAEQAYNELPSAEPKATKLAINSRILLDVVNSVTGAKIPSKANVLVHPFKLLAQHEQGLRTAFDAAKAACGPKLVAGSAEAGKVEANEDDDRNSDSTSDTERTAPTRLLDELQCLISFIESDVPLGRPAGTTIDTRVTFDRVRLMYQPGDIMVDAESEECGQAFVLMHVAGGRKLLDPLNRSQASAADDAERVMEPINSQVELTLWTPVRLTCWYLDFDGVNIGPQVHTITIEPFAGRRSIYQDGIRPLELCLERAVWERQLLSRVKRFIEASQIKRWFYAGRQLADLLMSLDDGAHASVCTYCAQVKTDQELGIDCIIDHGTALTQLARSGCKYRVSFHHEWRPWSDSRETFEMIPCSDPFCTRCTDVWDDSYCDPEDWTRSRKVLGKLAKPITPHELARLPQLDQVILPVSIRVIGYSLKEHVFLPLHLDRLSPVVSNGSPFDHLMLPENLKRMIQASVEMRARRSRSSQGPGSHANSRRLRVTGGNTVMLFHGPPGVGKTFAAEAVSQSLDQPLLSFSTSALGSEVAEFERRLTTYFTLARKWSCVVCLEDADQLVAQRSQHDSNLISSRFVQHLDAFVGIIILITNRVGTFDESLRSRIHVPIYFPVLNQASSSSIWRVTVRNMQEQYPELMIDEQDLLDFVESARYFDKWNGRQIINACETAAMLARYENEPFSVHHLKAVAETTQHFEQYLDAVHGVDEFERAASHREERRRPLPSRARRPRFNESDDHPNGPDSERWKTMYRYGA